MVYTYHNETKHSQLQYAKSLGYMDWATQPNPYRSYADTQKTELPLSFENKSLEYSQIFTQRREEEKVVAPLCLKSVSQFFQFSLGLAAIKEFGDQSWALRCNASSGNLQPSEAYIIAKDIEGIEDGLHHYAPLEHQLELLSATTSDFALPNNSFLVSLSSIVWREAWKYGERSWRYTQLDCGHALKALEVSALILGWKIEVVSTKDTELQSLIGFDQAHRYVPEERELADMLLLVTLDDTVQTTELNINIDINTLRNALEDVYIGKANQLSRDWHKWDILERIEDATLTDELKVFKNDVYEENPYRKSSALAKDIVLNRRSAQVMNKDNCTITKNEFETILGSVKSHNSPIHLVVFVHRVKDIDSGLYILVRNDAHKAELQSLLKKSFLWERVDTDAGALYKLQDGNMRAISKTISCNQDIASHGAFTLGMLAQFSEQITEFGASRYKELYWECGAIGQQLYLETTSLNLSATGIGCFLDDILHDVIGLKTNHFQTLYHFTIGRGLVDERLSTLKPYASRKIAL